MRLTYCVKENYYFDVITVLFAFYNIYFHVSFSGIILNIDFVILQLDCLFKCCFYYIKFHFFLLHAVHSGKNTCYYIGYILLSPNVAITYKVLLCVFLIPTSVKYSRYIFERRLLYFLYSFMLIGHRPPSNRLVNIFRICYNNKFISQMLYEYEQMMLHFKSIVMIIFFSAG